MSAANLQPEHWGEDDYKYLAEGRGLHCPSCDLTTKFAVIRTVPLKDKVVRTRQCLICGYVSETEEKWKTADHGERNPG